MQYRTLYDIVAFGYEEWLWAYISGGLVLAVLIVFIFFRSWRYRYGFLTVCGLIVTICFVLPYWDYCHLKAKLEAKDCQKTEGVVTNYWEKKWRDKDASNKWRDYHYESFVVNGVTFWYYITGSGSAAGFQNNGPTPIRIRNGMPLRIHYYAEPVITNGTINNRILKIELRE